MCPRSSSLATTVSGPGRGASRSSAPEARGGVGRRSWSRQRRNTPTQSAALRLARLPTEAKRAPRGPGPGLPSVPALSRPGSSGEDHPSGDRANPCSRCDPGFLFEAERWRPDKHGWSARSCLQGRELAASGECPGALQALGPGFQHPVVRFSPTPVWALLFCSAGPTAQNTRAGSEVRPSSSRERSPVGEGSSCGGKVK